MDILLGYGLILFGASGFISFICAIFASLVGLGAAPEIWAITKMFGYLFLACVLGAAIYNSYQEEVAKEEARSKHRARKRRRRR